MIHSLILRSLTLVYPHHKSLSAVGFSLHGNAPIESDMHLFTLQDAKYIINIKYRHLHFTLAMINSGYTLYPCNWMLLRWIEYYLKNHLNTSWKKNT